MAEKWSFYRNNKLKITECPNCESPITFTEFKAGGEGVFYDVKAIAKERSKE